MVTRHPLWPTWHLHDKMDIDILSAIQKSLNKFCTVSWDRVQKATVDNENLQMLKFSISNGFPDKPDELPGAIQSYWKFRDSLSIINNVILYNDWIIIPPFLQPEIYSIFHSANQGKNTVIERAKITVYWQWIKKSIYKLRDKCKVCSTTPSTKGTLHCNSFISSLSN